MLLFFSKKTTVIKTSKTLEGRSATFRVQVFFPFLFLIFLFFFERFLTFGQVTGNARDGRSRHRPTKVFEFAKLILRPRRSQSTWFTSASRNRIRSENSAGGWTRDSVIADWHDIENSVTSEVHVNRFKSKEVGINKLQLAFLFPCAQGHAHRPTLRQ